MYIFLKYNIKIIKIKLDSYLVTPKDRHLMNVDLKLYTKCPSLEKKKSHLSQGKFSQIWQF
jgi:hypothetical protein